LNSKFNIQKEDVMSTREELIETAYRVRKNALRMAELDGQGFISQALGAADILTAAYFHAMKYKANDPEWEGRDRFLLSAGHNAIAVYAAMAEAGFFPKDELDTYGLDNSRLPMSGMSSYTPGIEISGGSIGLGLPISVGMGLGLKRKNSASRVYVMMGDGELAEGPTWEAAISAANYHLDNIIALVDVNGIQADGHTEDVMKTEPLDKKFDAFGWYVQRINGNSISQLVTALDNAKVSKENKPNVILCDTVPGTGVPFLIGNSKSHFIRMSKEDWVLAYEVLERGKE
jgi:transketolase